MLSIALLTPLGCFDEGSSADDDGTGTDTGTDTETDTGTETPTGDGDTSTDTGGDSTGTGTGTDTGTDTGTGGTSDTTAPTIVSISPDTGATGVRKTTNIVITFSEPMDQTATQGAYDATDIPPASVAFSWNSDSTELTIDPDTDLDYATGTNVDTLEPIEYTFTISAAATDLAGNPLTQAESNFFTLRQITASLSGDTSLSGDIRADGSVNICSTGEICAGDSSSDEQYKGFFSFDVSGLPTGVEEMLSATISSDHRIIGSPYSALGGEVQAKHVEYSDLTFDAAFGIEPLSDAGILSNSNAEETKTMDVLTEVQDDYANTRSNSQYRLEFPTGTNSDSTWDAAVFDRTSTTLEIVYLVP